MTVSELPESVGGVVLTSLAPTSNGCASYQAEELGWIVRHHEGGWRAIGSSGLVVASDLSHKRDAVAVLKDRP